MGESGKHEIRTVQAVGGCFVDASELGWRDNQPPQGMDRKTRIATLPRRRSYDLTAGILEDSRLDGKIYANVDNLSIGLAQALQRCLKQNLKGMLEQ